ncbi:DUF5058 family protein [Hespellia stercorisuis]|uniref:DUF5058 domain-containing protein n=1 Tax=Hespellia stercorisuis DSM 15480 TaxID=1121950 RepID=A0A1M6UD17_9FIRM|nr:DUF5058 family protein [Hespellia stercorisuis]SHK66948.1 protein of unknown function [Hespellia stercorisuis DSM 15480]
MFNPNNMFLYGLAACVILFIIAQSLFFLVRAYRQAQKKGMDMKKIRQVIVSSAIFTIAPAVSILLGVVTLAKFLGLPLPWIRLSVIGAITYELPAATSTATALHVPLSELITDARVYSAIVWVMTLGILPSIIYVPVLFKRINRGMVSMKQRDEKWSDIFLTALFLGMISAFLGMVFSTIRTGIVGWIPVFVLLASAAAMAVCGICIKKCNAKWLENYALPISMIVAMIFSVFITNVIKG